MVRDAGFHQCTACAAVEMSPSILFIKTLVYILVKFKNDNLKKCRLERCLSS